jgi:mannitol/fructose-specific phosphotransferase system IIA component (Ntr-type)
MLVCILFLSIENLVKTASSIMLIMFILVNVSLIIMRQSGLQNYRPVFRSPLYPWMQIGGIVAYCFLLIEIGATALLLTGAFTLAVCVWYLVYVRKRIDRESALVFLMKRIASAQFGGRGLEDELKRIALERDEVEPDRFDKLVQRCEVLDIPEEITLRDLFARAAEALAPRVGVDKGKLEGMLLDRERSSSTVIEPGLAVPHVVVEGEHVFEILMARCQRGAAFSELHPPVKAAFFLVGSADERNYHLRALMSIAHIVRESGFQEAWDRAAGPEGLRDVALLSNRVRDRGSGAP